jgi:hypothetical protein
MEEVRYITIFGALTAVVALLIRLIRPRRRATAAA